MKQSMEKRNEHEKGFITYGTHLLPPLSSLSPTKHSLPPSKHSSPPSKLLSLLQRPPRIHLDPTSTLSPLSSFVIAHEALSSFVNAHEDSSFPCPLFVMFSIESLSKCFFFVAIGDSVEILQKKTSKTLFSCKSLSQTSSWGWLT